MGLFKTPLPPGPGPKSRPSPARESDVIARVGEASNWIARIHALLSPYAPRNITDATGRKYIVLAQDQGIGDVVGNTDHPFRLVTRTTDGGTTEGGVIFESSLFKSLRPNDKQAITGLLNEDRSTGWFNLTTDDAIWLGIVFDGSGNVTSATIDSKGGGETFDLTAEAWSGDDGYCEDDGNEDEPKHQTSRKLIAYTTASAGTPSTPVVHQVMRCDQILRNVCIDGKPARYPFDHEGGYPL